MYPDCNEIKLAKMDKNPLRNNLYAIDPDGAGGVPLFPAYCDFKTNERIGITEVRVPLFFYYIQGSSKSIFFFFKFSRYLITKVHVRKQSKSILIIHVQSV